MLHYLKISHHEHTGRLRPHEHTSYLPLAFLSLMVGVALAAYTVTSSAQTPPPEPSSISLTGTVPAPPPKEKAVIEKPVNGQRFTTSPINVSGTCPSGTLVQIFKNNIFAGSTPCEDNETFSLDADLLFGENVLKAQVFDALNQAGPESDPVTIFYDAAISAPAPSSFIDLIGTQLILNTDAAFRGIFPKQKFNVPITVIGGTPPHAINVQWGDSTNDVIARSDNNTFNISHSYEKPGTYKIIIQGKDSKDLAAFLTVAAIVNGELEPIAVSSTTPTTNKLFMLWPLYAIGTTAMFSFWLGERREKRLLSSKFNPSASNFSVLPHPPAQQ